MPKMVKELTDAAVRKLRHGQVKGDPKVRPEARKRAPGSPCVAYHPVGGVSGLMLQCRPPTGGAEIGARSWILRTMVGTRRRDIGLGGYPDVTLSMARQKAREAKELIAQGVDPVADRKARRSALLAEQAKAVTFEALARDFVEKKAEEYKTAKQVQKLETMLKTYAFPHIGRMVVGDIERAHIIAMLSPIWKSKTETATRTRMYVERILDLGGIRGLRTGDNPARWKGNLDHEFADRNKVTKVQNYKALPVKELPDFWRKLRTREGMGARALEFLILTAARSGEVRGATWKEIDLERRVWTIPADRMKAGKEHRVPLSAAAVALLEAMPRESEYIFYNRNGRPVSDVTISKVPKTLGCQVTAHGFRSTFKDWCIEYTAFPDEISELALAHVNSDKTRAAYARSDAFKKRAQLMAEWERYCQGLARPSAEVVSIEARG
ncbi:tyrosine-type recombinase/integrase [Microbulbifer sp.]|uniref:phage integrase central domain-containing protein n=1 Tax=Microbulbifer sp. TaxID=1908541 RepID=UPI002587AA1E|nr:tyrosine-type recombinase/integrase [Microbulbifer sp.]